MGVPHPAMLRGGCAVTRNPSRLPGAKQEAVGKHKDRHCQKHENSADPEERAVMDTLPPGTMRLAAVKVRSATMFLQVF